MLGPKTTEDSSAVSQHRLNQKFSSVCGAAYPILDRTWGPFLESPDN